LPLSFQPEKWKHLWNEGQALFQLHYDELALHKDVMPMGLDNNFYAGLELRNFLLVVTARRDSKLIGYFVGIVIAHHPHNKDAGKVATTDMFYIAPEERKGGAGAKLLIAAESEMRRHGVKKATISTKIKFENGALLDALGWEKTDIVRQKTF
jgi:GNAT superfamily N-acetyltransferase